jgi:adenylate cyclase
VIIFSDILGPVSSRFSRFLLIETVPNPRVLIEQDHLVQIVMVFLIAILAGVTLPHFQLLSAAALTIIYFLMYLGYAFDKFNNGILVQPLYPALALFLMFACSMTFRYLSEERRRELISRLFRRHVAPDTVDRVIDDFVSGTLPLGGIRRKVSVLAIDLTELEPLVESMTPEVLIGLLDQYVSLIVAVIFRHDGTLVNYTGSTLLAAWNLLIDQPDHARRAVCTAAEIKHDIAQFNQKQQKELAIKAGMGIATGEVIAGRIGTPARAEYALIGEVVGMAERIALKPDRGIFIDGLTRGEIGDEFEMVEVNPVRLRRKTDPSQVWQVLLPMELEEQVSAEVANRTERAN